MTRGKTILLLSLLIFVAVAAGLLYSSAAKASLANNVLRRRIELISKEISSKQYAAAKFIAANKLAAAKDTITSLPPNGNGVSTIIYNKYGFDPNIDVVPLGLKVTMKNETAQAVNIQALDWYGRQITGSPLSLGVIDANQEKSFKLTVAGTIQYQANSTPAIRAQIVAK